MTAPPTFRPGRVHPLVRALNLIGPALGGRWLDVGFTEESVLDTVRRRTGLEEFGDQQFREPLRVLLEAFRGDRRIAFFGRLFAREQVLWSLGQRLEIAKLQGTHPEIFEAAVERPLFITGLPRTGTTLLFRLLGLDRSRRWLTLRDLLSCVPWPDRRGRDRRDVFARRLASSVNRLVPELRVVHPIDTRLPVEDFELTNRSFISPAYALQAELSGYQAWLDEQPLPVRSEAYTFHRLQLQALQRGSPRRGWLLKSPTHLGQLDALLAVYPDARIIITHRDPAEVVPSACSLLGILRGRTGGRVDPITLGASVTELLVRAQRQAMAARHRCDPAQICDVAYTDLVRSPIDTLRSIYRHLEQAMPASVEKTARAWLDEDSRRPRPRHRYSLEQFGLDAEVLRRRLTTGRGQRIETSPEDARRCRGFTSIRNTIP